MKLVRQTYKQALLAEYDGKLYEAAMTQILSNYNGIAPDMPRIVYGDASKDMIINSHYYLAP